MRKNTKPLLALAASLALAQALHAAGVVSYQGRIDVGGSAYTGTAYVKFAVVDQAGTTSYWSNDGTSAGGGEPAAAVQVSVSGGLFEVLLGDTTVPNMTVPLTGAEFGAGDRSLRVWLSTDNVTFTQMVPDRRLASAPTALQTVQSGDGSGITNINASQITSGTLNDARLSANVALLDRSPQAFAGQNRFGDTATFAGNETFQTPIVATSTKIGGASSGPETTIFKVDRSGGLLATGFVQDVGNTTGCAAYIPATGAGTRFMWHPCRGSLRFGRVPVGAPTTWDDANMDDFTFAGGNQVIASGYGAFAYGDQVTVSSTVGVGFGSGVTVSGTAGFSSGASNVCSGFACTALGYTTTSAGQGSVAIGYRTAACGDYSVAIGYRASTNSTSASPGPPVNPCSSGTNHTGSFVFGDESSTASFNAVADNEFAARAAGGFRFRTNSALTTGCNLPAGSGVFSCASTRDVKENFADVDGEEVLGKLASVPVVRWSYIGDESRAAHLGPMAEDFKAAFDLGESDKTIGVQDLSGVALVAAQALEKRTRAMVEENARLQSENRELRERLARIEEKLGLR